MQLEDIYRRIEVSWSYGLRLRPRTHILLTSEKLYKLFVLFDAHEGQRREVGYTLCFFYERFAWLMARRDYVHLLGWLFGGRLLAQVRVDRIRAIVHHE